MEANELLKTYLEQEHKLQLATAVDGQPWSCTVYFVADEDWNLYWASLPTRRHSREIKQNPKVAAAIAIKGVIGEKVIGIQIEGTAQELRPGMYDREVVERYAARFGRDESWVSDFINGKTEHQLYKLTSRGIDLFDEENFPGGQRQKVL
jgi:uncharacterized protein YhbP (UPF0306 family)